MSPTPRLSERYDHGDDVLNFVVYSRGGGQGEDRVLQHKRFGTTGMAHVTWHPDGTVNVRVARNRTLIDRAIRTRLAGFAPGPSAELPDFLDYVRQRI